VALVRYALDRGVNLLDCSAAYGQAESLVGKAVAGRRTKVFIATKCGLTPDGRRSREAGFLRGALMSSLAAVGAEAVDLLQAALGPGDPVEPALEAISSFKRQGLALGIGISAADPGQVEQAAASGVCDAVQLTLNLLDTRCWEAAARAAAAGVAVLIKSPLNKGVLASSDLGRSLPEDDSRRAYLTDEVVDRRRAAAAAILEEGGLGAGGIEEAATGFALSAPFAAAVLFGARRLEHVDRFLRVARQGPMPPATRNALRAASQRAWHRVAPTFGTDGGHA
jgi:aryl-alcohol dehydrogenase-like predicted oxidoreductase